MKYGWPEPKLPPINLWNAPSYWGERKAGKTVASKHRPRMKYNHELIARLTRR